MKQPWILAIVMAAALGLTAYAEHPDAPEWLDDYEAAKTQARETGRPILINFSGSDWCGWCIRLDEEVLEKPEFKSFAADNLILFVADFPRQMKLPEATAIQNRALAQKFGVRGFPTILLVEADGTTIARTGYQAGGADAYVEHLKELLADRTDT